MMDTATDKMSSTVQVLFFASLREDTGLSRLSIEAGSVSELLDAISSRLAPQALSVLRRDNVRIAVNQKIIEGDSVLKAGDEVAFLPPVTGG